MEHYLTPKGLFEQLEEFSINEIASPHVHRQRDSRHDGIFTDIVISLPDPCRIKKEKRAGEIRFTFVCETVNMKVSQIQILDGFEYVAEFTKGDPDSFYKYIMILEIAYPDVFKDFVFRRKERKIL